MRLGFNPREYAGRSKPNGRDTKFKPVPEGFYEVECIELTDTVSKAGDKMLKAKFEILDPPFSDAGYVWEYFLMECAASTDALEIARERLAQWVEAAGKLDLQDTSELEHTRCRVKLVIEPGKGDYGPSNKIKFFATPKDKSHKVQPKVDHPKPTPSKELDDDIPF